jgi:hypothetical protein
MTETLVAEAFRRSRRQKRSVSNRRLRIWNCAMTATASNEPSASVIFGKRPTLFATSATWLKPKGTTLMSASAGVTHHLAAHQKEQGIARERFYHGEQD